MAAMKIHISASAKEALDAVGGYYTELRGTWALDLYRQSIRGFFCSRIIVDLCQVERVSNVEIGIL
jgi:hypothetical protein